MSTSITQTHRDIIVNHLTSIKKGQWKYLICNRESRQILKATGARDATLSGQYLDTRLIEESRASDTVTTAVYFLTPRDHVIKWLKADVNRRWYKEVYVVWTSPPTNSRTGLDIPLDGYVISTATLNIEYIPLESQLVTFGQPDSTQILFNPDCDKLIGQHVHSISQKIISICISLGEYPIVRYYQSSAEYRAKVLCAHLARFVQEGLDAYAASRASGNNPFPPPSSRPRAILLITDRTMDLMAPLVHEFTYQAMVMDLLPIEEEEKRREVERIKRREERAKRREKEGKEDVDFEDSEDEQDKEIKDSRQEVDEKQELKPVSADLKDKQQIWERYRHSHMKDLLPILTNEFKKFQAKNPQFANMDDQKVSVNTIKDMLAGLPDFQQGKADFSLHINIADRCMKILQDQKLLEITSLEQSLATGLDDDNQRPKNTTDQLVRLLADELVLPESRKRLLLMYILYRGGILSGDANKLMSHGQLPTSQDMIYNLQNLGAKVHRNLNEGASQYRPLYPAKEIKYAPGEEVEISRFEPVLRYALEEIAEGKLDAKKFPSTKPELEGSNQQTNSLRSAGRQANWAKQPSTANKFQRILVFIAGGATYSEARVSYAISQQKSKEILLMTTHMITPRKFLDEAGKLHRPRRDLRLKVDEAPGMPEWMQEPRPIASTSQQPASQQRPNQPSSRPPTESMQNMNLGPPRPQNGSSRPGSAQTPTPPTSAGSFSAQVDPSREKPKKEKKDKAFARWRKH